MSSMDAAANGKPDGGAGMPPKFKPLAAAELSRDEKAPSVQINQMTLGPLHTSAPPPAAPIPIRPTPSSRVPAPPKFRQPPLPVVPLAMAPVPMRPWPDPEPPASSPACTATAPPVAEVDEPDVIDAQETPQRLGPFEWVPPAMLEPSPVLPLEEIEVSEPAGQTAVPAITIGGLEWPPDEIVEVVGQNFWTPRHLRERRSSRAIEEPVQAGHRRASRTGSPVTAGVLDFKKPTEKSPHQAGRHEDKCRCQCRSDRKPFTEWPWTQFH